MVNKFKKATIELGDTSEVIICNSDNDKDDNEDIEREASLIGKIFIEGTMSHKMVEKYIPFNWPFISSEDLKVVEIDPNVMVSKFSKKELLKLVWI